MSFNLFKKYNEEVVPQIMRERGYKTPLAVPKIKKVVINTGIGSAKDEGQKEAIKQQLALIAGQQPAGRPAKKAISGFKTRKGTIVGYSVTLRRRRMYDFLNRMLYVALPRKRDFRGLNQGAIDECGNLTIGFKEHNLFPEMAGKDIKHLFGLEVTIVTDAKTREEARELFTLLGFPFKNSEQKRELKRDS
jgi:large subunit ribosomal protein L5